MRLESQNTGRFERSELEALVRRERLLRLWKAALGSLAFYTAAGFVVGAVGVVLFRVFAR